MSQSEIAERLAAVNQSIAGAAERAGRRPEDVKLAAVTKTVPSEVVAQAIDAGQRLFGENRVQEASAKVSSLQPDARIEWHLIGHLQSNKARTAIDIFTLIQSVDSISLAWRLDQLARRNGKPVRVLLEVNVAEEASKSGFRREELMHAVDSLQALSHVEYLGLMTIAPLVQDSEDVRWVFRDLRRIRDVLRDRMRSTAFTELSMGMSGDYQVAIEEGATIVRIGRAIFGDRPAAGGRPHRA